MDSRTTVLLAGGGAAWEPAALGALEGRAGLVVLRRCLDLTDLLAHAATGQASVAVLGLELAGLDATAAAQLAGHGVQLVGVVPTGAPEHLLAHATALGVRRLVPAADLIGLPEAVLDVARSAPAQPAAPVPEAGASAPVLAVWGPTGGPGRTTVALGVAAELAGRGLDPLVLDVDPWGGAVAQHLGVLDEVSGLLAAARAAGEGALEARFGALQRRAAGLRIVTGLPRADRWSEVRPGVVGDLVALGRAQGPVVLDVGFCLEEDAAAEYAGRPPRTGMTLAALEEADLVVAVGTADPVGLSRLARGLAELGERGVAVPVHVVVNRWRSRLGWAESDVGGLFRGFGEVAGLHFLPDDPVAADKALRTGRSLAEVGDSALARGLARLVDALGVAPGVSRRSGSRRPGGRSRRSRSARRRAAPAPGR